MTLRKVVMSDMQQALHQAFLEQANKTPDRVCLIDTNYVLTYKQVKWLVFAFVEKFQNYGIQNNTIVGLYSGKRVESIIAFLAVSVLGGQNVQLDKAFPQPFFKSILQETQTQFLLCDEPLNLDDIDHQVQIINISKLLLENNNKYVNIQLPLIDPCSILWLVYSSGTTGVHKGIAISHEAILSSYYMRYQVKDYDQNSVIGCNIYYFWEVFRPLLRGGTSVIIHDDVLHDFEKLANIIQTHGINEFLFTPSYLETLLFSDLNSAKKIFNALDTCWLNGEVVSHALYEQLLPFMNQTAIYNLYSISECHDVAVYQLKPNDSVVEEEGFVPVGFALNLVENVILNKDQQRCVPGEKGELYVHTPGLAKEYINRKDLTQERFIEADKSIINKRLYKTGDYAKLTQNKQLITVYGRCDYFIRLRGYNISLPFVEAILKEKLQAMHCVVVKAGEFVIDEHLVAYLEIPAEKQFDYRKKWAFAEKECSSQKLIDAISPYLANYMLPQKFILVNEISINPYSNKLDRKSLKPNDQYADLKKIEQINDLEDYRYLWSKILKVKPESISNKMCFFKLGGTSLSAMMLLSNVSRIGLKKMTISEFLESSDLFGSYQKLTSPSFVVKNNDLLMCINQDIQKASSKLSQKNTPFNNSNQLKEKTWLLTGVTGFLGIHLLEKILNDTSDKLVCLIRAENQQQAWQRLENKANLLRIPLSLLKYRVQVLSGDIAQKHLGLEYSKYQSLAALISGVIHAAANVNLILPYSAFKSVCVDGLGALANLCLVDTPKPFYHVSTNGIFPETIGHFEESVNIDDYLPLLESGYGQAKWASEKLLTQARLLGLPLSIFRPGNICHSNDQNINLSDMNWLILKSICLLGSVPEGLALEMTPVSHIAGFIIKSVQNDLKNNIFNMTNKNYLLAKDIAEDLNLPIVAKAHWQKNISDPNLKCLIEHYPNWLNAKADYQQLQYEQMMKHYSMSYINILKTDFMNCFKSPSNKPSASSRY